MAKMREYGKDFAEDVKLDKLDLANEAEVMSSLMQFYTGQLAQAKAHRDDIDNRLDYAKAEAYLHYSKNGTGLPKDTVDSIKAAVLVDDKVSSLAEELVKAKEEVYTFESAVDAMRNKSDMIKVEQNLFQSGYFSAQ
jgi:hypothetical protein